MTICTDCLHRVIRCFTPNIPPNDEMTASTHNNHCSPYWQWSKMPVSQSLCGTCSVVLRMIKRWRLLVCVGGGGGGFTVTYSCFLPRAKLRTAGSVTRLQIVLFLFQTLEIFKHVGNNISLKEFCICQNYARSVGKSSRHHRRAKTTWILFCVAVYHSHRPHALTALSRWIEESVCECELPKISVFTQPFLDKLLPPKQTLKNNHLSRVKLTLLAPLKPT